MHTAPAHATSIQSCIADLTPRERQVMDYVALGAPNKAIARALSLSPRTVEHYRANLFHKLQVHNAVELTRFLHGDMARQGWRAHVTFPTHGSVPPACPSETPCVQAPKNRSGT